MFKPANVVDGIPTAGLLREGDEENAKGVLARATYTNGTVYFIPHIKNFLQLSSSLIGAGCGCGYDASALRTCVASRSRPSQFVGML